MTVLSSRPGSNASDVVGGSDYLWNEDNDDDDKNEGCHGNDSGINDYNHFHREINGNGQFGTSLCVCRGKMRTGTNFGVNSSSSLSASPSSSSLLISSCKAELSSSSSSSTSSTSSSKMLPPPPQLPPIPPFIRESSLTSLPSPPFSLSPLTEPPPPQQQQQQPSPCHNHYLHGFKPPSSPILLLASLLFLACFCVQYSNGDLVTLSPLPGKSASVTSKDALLIILPEKGVPHTDYKIFGRMLQQLYPLRLWVELVEVPKGRELTLDNLPLIVAESNRRLNDLVFMREKPDVFLAAHGYYGHLAADYARAVPSSLRGLVLMGAFLPKRWTVASFPLPVLTVAGELDGLTRITRIAEALGRMISDASFEPSLVTQSPLVLLEGCNHDVYISGQLPVHMHQMDIDSEQDKSVAMEMAANVTSLFLVHTLQEPASLVEEAASVFRASFERAQILTKPIRDIRGMTQDTNFKSYWVKSAQKWLSGLEGKESSYLEVDSYVVVDGSSPLALPPALVIEEGIPYVVTFSDILSSARSKMADIMSDVNMAEEEEDSGISPQAPKEIAARMLGPERIQKFLQNTSIAKNYTCRDLNYCSFMTAYRSIPDKARQRYDSYRRGVFFEPDNVTDSEALWESTELKIDVRDRRSIHVTSIAYTTPQDEGLSQYSGLFFCKLLPPDRALEWIYVDALRRSLSTKLL